eukprot:6174825-Ditylum_brightwellii.AAC.1
MVASEENKECDGMEIVVVVVVIKLVVVIIRVAVAIIKLVADNSITVKMDPAVVAMVKDCTAIIVEATLMNSKMVKGAKTMTIEVED